MSKDEPLPKLLGFIILAIVITCFTLKQPIGADSVAVLHTGDNYIIANAPHFYDHYSVLATVNRIMFCESSDNPDAQNSGSSAYGFCQFLNQTWNYVETKWDIDLDRESPADQFYACERLYREEGRSHWLESEYCWGK